MKRCLNDEPDTDDVLKRRQLMPDLKDYLMIHQRRVLKKVQACSELPGQLLWWPMGWGKTRGAIFLLELGWKVKGPILVITRAALVNNFHQELEKLKDFGFQKSRYTSVGYESYCSNPSKYQDFEAIVMDEIHHVRNAQSTRYLPIFQACQKAKKVVALSGTPYVNHGSDLGSILNLILASKDGRGKTTKIVKCEEWTGKGRQPYLPTTKKLWEYRYGDKNHQNWCHLKLYTSTLISYFEKDKKSDDYLQHFPTVHYRTLEVPMDEKHYQTYAKLDNEVRPEESYSKKLSKKKSLQLEDQNHDRLLGNLQNRMGLSQTNHAQFLGYVTKMRQASNFLGDDKCTKFRQVIMNVIQKIRKDSNYKAVIYSNFLKHGVDYFARHLKKFKIPFNSVQGSTKDVNEPVSQFNSGKIKVLLITQSGVEGLNLTSKGGEVEIFLMEPHWNETRLRQAECRVIQYDCGASKVTVWRLVSVAPLKFQDKDWEVQPIDTVLNKICGRKDEGLEGWIRLVKKHSIDSIPMDDLRNRVGCVM